MVRLFPKTDARAIELGMDLNPMISGCMIKVFGDCDGKKMAQSMRERSPEGRKGLPLFR